MYSWQVTNAMGKFLRQLITKLSPAMTVGKLHIHGISKLPKPSHACTGNIDNQLVYDTV